MKTEAERFNIYHPELCPMLRWKQQFYDAERDAEIPPTNDGHFWCVMSQSCLGPDNALAEPGDCTSPERKCYGTGLV